MAGVSELVRERARPVGPLPPEVYWRRRVVLAAILLVPLLIFTTCAVRGDDEKSGGGKKSSASEPGQQEPPPEVQDGSREHPWYPEKGAPPDGQQVTDVESAAAVQPEVAAPPPNPQCADSELTVEAIPEHGRYPAGSRLKIKLVITNSSDRDCLRDVGSAQQEMMAQVNGQVVWSSDHCATGGAGDERTLKSGERLEFWVVWAGESSAPGCGAAGRVAAGDYAIVARLGSLLSQPATVSLT